MSSNITVHDFKYIKGQNDAEYIKLLEKELEAQRKLTAKAIAKLKNAPTIEPKNVPSADVVERKRGKWIDCGSYYKCPFCKHIVMENDGKPKFCEECGADMRGKK